MHHESIINYLKYLFFNFRDLRQRHRASHRMSQEGARVNGFPAAARPRGIHEIRTFGVAEHERIKVLRAGRVPARLCTAYFYEGDSRL